MKIKLHHLQQRAYFQKEFSQIKKYRLAPWQKNYVQRIKNHLLGKNFKNKTLIDIGTGSGYVAIEMARLGMKVIAIDLSSQAIENLRKYKKKFNLRNLNPKKCLAEKIPLSDKSVDYLVANAILEHIPNEKKAISEWKRILKPKGKILITAPLKFKHFWPFLWPLNYWHDQRIGHLRRYDLESLQKKFNLRVIKYFYTGHLLKVLGAVFTCVFKFQGISQWFERKDESLLGRRYGASNISVIFQK